ILPLKKEGTIALVGPLADNKENMAGTWSVAADYSKSVSLMAGMKEVAGPGVTWVSARGANVVDDPQLEARVSVFGKPTYRDDRPEKDMIREAVAAAKKADVVVAALGEAAEMSGESSSRSNIDLPANQRRLLEALLATGKPVVLVLFTGRPLALKWETENVPAILNVWFGGSEAGAAIADVLFGDVNPSGKLTMTFPQNLGQVPIFYNHKNTGRPLEGEWFQKFRSNYLDVPNEPLFPFGYGLSYSSFTYGKMEVSSTGLQGDEKLEVSVPVTNSSEVKGKEIVQLYIRDLVGSTTRPVKELKNFQKIELEAGETKTVTFNVTTDDLAFYTYDPATGDQTIHYDWEPGEFHVMVGGNARDLQKETVRWSR
ncbi:MAG: glycoside hydrolase family 3 C-terminal domain-containing protein, partial [Cytophagales bacterium]|nr:glycoside hydrolase family 3 C-terminal domain-containing protein [Cytophagales bacterium]